MEDINFDITMTSPDEAEEAVSGGGRGRTSKYEPVLEKYKEAQENGEAIILKEMTQNAVQNLRNLFYRRFDKEDVIVRSKETGEDEYTVAIRERMEGEYLRNGEPDVEAETDGAIPDDDVEEVGDEDDELEPSF